MATKTSLPQHLSVVCSGIRSDRVQSCGMYHTLCQKNKLQMKNMDFPCVREIHWQDRDTFCITSDLKGRKQKTKKKLICIFQTPEKTNWHKRMRDRMTWMDRLCRLSWGGVCTVTFFDWTVRPVSVFQLHFKQPLSHVWDSVQFQTCKGRLRKHVLT